MTPAGRIRGAAPNGGAAPRHLYPSNKISRATNFRLAGQVLGKCHTGDTEDRDTAAMGCGEEANMPGWKSGGVEPSIDELLDDEVMVPVMRSAGVCAGDLRALVAETAERLQQEPPCSSRGPVD